MTLTELLDTLKASLQTELSDWDVTVEEIPFPKDKLVEIVYLDFDYRQVDMTTYAFTGSLGVVLYKQFSSSYKDQINAVETTLEWLGNLNLSNLTVGNNTSVVSNISRPSVSDDGRTLYRVIMVGVPFELINS